MLNKSVLNEQVNRPFPVCDIQLGCSFIIITICEKHMLYIKEHRAAFSDTYRVWMSVKIVLKSDSC